MLAFDHDLSCMLEVHGHPPVDIRLDLPQTPVRCGWIANQHSGFQKTVHTTCSERAMMPDAPDLAALIGSRICHDLISPIGAIGNGVELLMMDGSVQTPEMTLISESVAQANARIRYFRIAFGAADLRDQRVARAEVQAILSEQTRGSRLGMTWSSASELARVEVKLTFLLLMCLENALPFGGRIVVTQEDDRWFISAEADRIKKDDALWAHLNDPTTAIEATPGRVHFALVPGELSRTGRKLSVRFSETRIDLTY
jgi:histidine phosphotransferase ChpT